LEGACADAIKETRSFRIRLKAEMPVKSHLVHIGTSGWYYDHWKGNFYPAGLRKEDFLNFYSESFSTVEINNSFYRLPSESTFEKWREKSPQEFLFAVKATRYITHLKRLKEPQKSVSLFLERARLLGDKLGPILFQLPPKFGCNQERLVELLGALPEELKYAFEFRDQSWLNPQVYDILESRGASLCLHGFPGISVPRRSTANFVYIRLHGPDGAYQGSYSDDELCSWVNSIKGWINQGKEIFCYFDNDEAGNAARNATRLNRMLLVDKVACGN
jgi:uncharacterized protein YecE (DUF72 family)